MIDFLTALALVLVIEGILYAAFPEQMKQVVARMTALPSAHLRASGLAAAVIGVLLVWVLR